MYRQATFACRKYCVVFTHSVKHVLQYLPEKLYSVCTHFATLASAIVSYLILLNRACWTWYVTSNCLAFANAKIGFHYEWTPAIWRKVSKQFMRERVLRAGFACNYCGLNNTLSDICIDNSSFATYSCKSQPNVLSVWMFEGFGFAFASAK